MMDWNAPHTAFVIVAYLITFAALGLMIWTSLRVARRRAAELERLERELRGKKDAP